MIEMMEIYNHVDIWLLIFIRILFALFFLPIMTETKLPPLAKGGLTAALSLIVFYTIPSTSVAGLDSTLIGFFLVIIKEALIGLIMGFGILIFFQLYYFVGHLWSIQGGIGMSTLMDPNSGTQVPIVGKFYYLGFATVFLASGGYHWFIQAVVESFVHIPIGQGVLNGEIMYPIIGAISTFFELGFKLSAPIIAVLFLIDCGLGILARTVPQMNMFVIGLPLKMLVLFSLLLITITLFPLFNEIIIKHLVDAFYQIVQGMVP
ncbi:MAG: flagellar biosynthetic protein FliR [Cellulosilyticaceae bacterium]